MADLIRHKRSSVPSAVPAAGDLELGELAVNVADGRLFLKKGDGTVVDVTSIGGIQGLTAALAGKMTNPMTTAGDMIRGGTSGAPERVAAGANGYVWTMVAGVPGWAAPAGGSDVWLSRAIGEPFPIWDHIAGVPVPPTDNAGYRYIKLTASDSYNSGVLTSESVSGSAPLVHATAVISDASSPLNGRAVRLINTERRVIRAGSSGTVEQDAVQDHGHRTVGVAANAGTIGSYITALANTSISAGDQTGSGAAPTRWRDDQVTDVVDARTDTETRPKNIGATYYMRIR